MQRIVVDLYISAEQYLAHYQGQVENVSALAVDGRRVQFPCKILQPYLLHSGIRGRFQITFNNQGRFQKIEKLA